MRISKNNLLTFVRRCFPKKIVDLSCEKLGGDASDRNYYRLHLNRSGTDLPETLVVMELQSAFSGQELPFINILHTLERSGLGVPGLYGIDPDQGLVLLEDLGDEILQEKIRGQNPDRVESLYHEALDIVVKMQCDLVPSSRCVAFETAFTVEKFVWELNFFRVHYIEGLLEKRIHPNDRKAMDRLFLWLSSLMDGENKVFTHRDFHSRNLIYHAGMLKMLDFQDARMGLSQYDVASLLRDSYVVLDDVLMESLLDYYVSELEGKTKENIDRPRFRYVFDMTSLQRNLKAIGTFAYQAVERKNSRYLKYIPDTLAYIKRNLDRYDELAPYRQVFARYLPFDEL
jgi:aminoglycoside/choline kinase family phosphotransferase